MLNEERIILMTKLASYEENEGKKNMAIGRYFRSDYLAVQILKAVVCATVSFGVLFGLFIFYDFEIFMQDVYKMDLISLARNTLFLYVLLVAVYCAVCYAAFAYKYTKAKKSLKLYYQNLKKLNSLYNE